MVIVHTFIRRMMAMVIFVVLWAGTPGPIRAEEQQVAPVPAPARQNTAQSSDIGQGQPTPETRGADIDPRLVLILVRNVYTAVGQAIAAGNYSVLRDLAAPDFRRAYPEARIEEIFRPLAAGGADFTQAVLLVPRDATAERTADGGLTIRGRMDTNPPTRFVLVFQPIAGSFQLQAIDLQPANAEPPAPPPSQPSE